MADLDDGEFDFDSTPALGGPEEPDAPGSAVAAGDVLIAMQGLADQLDTFSQDVLVRLSRRADEARGQ
jgi:hypothetical protein